MKIDVFIHAQSGIQILAQTLRHIGDAVRQITAHGFIGHIAAQHRHCALLNDPHPRHQRQQRRFAHPVRPDQAHGYSARNGQQYIIQRQGFAVAVAEGFDGNGGWGVHKCWLGCSGFSDGLFPFRSNGCYCRAQALSGKCLRLVFMFYSQIEKVYRFYLAKACYAHFKKEAIYCGSLTAKSAGHGVCSSIRT